MSILAALLAIQSGVATVDEEILITASRVEVKEAQSPASATIIDERRIEALGELQAVDLLRLTPSVAVSTSGSRGTLSQIRIRGAEANHSLLFVDGILFNDPASGNEPRFETLTADGLGRVEIVRGPQSALWGSEAIGGVIAIDSISPLGGTLVSGLAEYGSRDSIRAAATGRFGNEASGIAIGAGHQRSDGIDIIGGGAGDRDGYRNTTLSARGAAQTGSVEFGFAGRFIDAKSEFDGSDPLTFQRADTLDNSLTRTGAGRVYARFGLDDSADWAGIADVQYLASSNRNLRGTTRLNRTGGDRVRASAQVERRLQGHKLIGAIDHEYESFTARDQDNFGFTNQAVNRERTGFTAEWRAEWSDALTTDIAVRHDAFSRFEDATTLRASILLQLGGGFALAGGYGEGVARPTFYDLYGFFPGSFVGNPDLKPERSRGFEAGLRYRGARVSASLAGYRQTLKDEIVGTFDSTTFLASAANASGKSRRQGIEAAVEWQPIDALRLSANYSYLDAEDQQVDGNARLREVRRPKHSGAIAFDWTSDRLTVGGSAAYVGKHLDTDFDLFPAPTVTLDDYLLASLRVGYKVTDEIEVYARGDNLGDADYQDVVGYATPGRSLYAGIRLRFGD